MGIKGNSKGLPNLVRVFHFATTGANVVRRAEGGSLVPITLSVFRLTSPNYINITLSGGICSCNQTCCKI